jgi:CHAP domain
MDAGHGHGEEGSQDGAYRLLIGALVSAVLAGLLVLVLVVSLLLAPAALIAFGDGGGDGYGCPTPTTIGSPTAGTQPSSTGAGTDCINPDGNAIVAVAMAAHLHGNPDVWYDSGFPPAVIAYWQQTCPGCREWQNGNLQCVMFALAAYGVAGIRPPAAGNAIRFWALYAQRPGWIEIPSAVAPPEERGLPQPGDWMVWFNVHEPGVGHIAVVIQVHAPFAGQAGSVTFAEANGPGPIVTQTLLPDLTVLTWRNGYSVVGYIRHL